MPNNDDDDVAETGFCRYTDAMQQAQ